MKIENENESRGWGGRDDRGPTGYPNRNCVTIVSIVSIVPIVPISTGYSTGMDEEKLQSM